MVLEEDYSEEVPVTSEVRSGMRALHGAREGQKVVLLNASERSLN